MNITWDWIPYIYNNNHWPIYGMYTNIPYTYLWYVFVSSSNEKHSNAENRYYHFMTWNNSINFKINRFHMNLDIHTDNKNQHETGKSNLQFMACHVACLWIFNFNYIIFSFSFQIIIFLFFFVYFYFVECLDAPAVDLFNENFLNRAYNDEQIDPNNNVNG